MLLITGTIHLPPARLAEALAAMPAMRAMIEASPAKPGCRECRDAEEILDPGPTHINGLWGRPARRQRQYDIGSGWRHRFGYGFDYRIRRPRVSSAHAKRLVTRARGQLVAGRVPRRYMRAVIKLDDKVNAAVVIKEHEINDFAIKAVARPHAFAPLLAPFRL
jgi:hypothetical protein